MQRIVVPPTFGNFTQCASPQTAQSVTSLHSVAATQGPQQPDSVTLGVSPAGQVGGSLSHSAAWALHVVANVQRPSVHWAIGATPCSSQALLAQARRHAGKDAPFGTAWQAQQSSAISQSASVTHSGKPEAPASVPPGGTALSTSTLGSAAALATELAVLLGDALGVAVGAGVPEPAFGLRSPPSVVVTLPASGVAGPLLLGAPFEATPAVFNVAGVDVTGALRSVLPLQAQALVSPSTRNVTVRIGSLAA